MQAPECMPRLNKINLIKMDENKLNNYTKKLFENLEFERPPKDFTEKLMQKLESVKTAEKVKPKPLFPNKFLLIFVLTFSLILIVSYFFQGGQGTESTMTGLWQKISIPEFNPDFLSKYFKINIEFGLIAKIIIGSVITLILVDAASGSLIDRIIDTKTKKENQV